MAAAWPFRRFRFPAEVILWAVRWHLQFPLGYRDLERMLADRGVAVDHVSLFRWVQRFAPELESSRPVMAISLCACFLRIKALPGLDLLRPGGIGHVRVVGRDLPVRTPGERRTAVVAVRTPAHAPRCGPPPC